MRRSTVRKYLATIDSIGEEKGEVNTGDVAESLGVTGPSVSESFKKLSEEGYLRWRPHAGVQLTPRGKEFAKSIEQNRKVLTDFLIGIGVDEELAKEQAALMESEISNETIERLQDLIGWI